MKSSFLSSISNLLNMSSLFLVLLVHEVLFLCFYSTSHLTLDVGVLVSLISYRVIGYFSMFLYAIHTSLRGCVYVDFALMWWTMLHIVYELIKLCTIGLSYEITTITGCKSYILLVLGVSIFVFIKFLSELTYLKLKDLLAMM